MTGNHPAQAAQTSHPHKYKASLHLQKAAKVEEGTIRRRKAILYKELAISMQTRNKTRMAPSGRNVGYAVAFQPLHRHRV